MAQGYDISGTDGQNLERKIDEIVDRTFPARKRCSMEGLRSRRGFVFRNAVCNTLSIVALDFVQADCLHTSIPGFPWVTQS